MTINPFLQISRPHRKVPKLVYEKLVFQNDILTSKRIMLEMYLLNCIETSWFHQFRTTIQPFSFLHYPDLLLLYNFVVAAIYYIP